MFGSRRHRPPNPPLTAATANPHAATAAAAVFKRHESNSSLSAAAAAAALRARPTTPTRVADVQTKRTVRRSASVASTATASEQAQDRPGLQRRGSSGSMTERTFRSPSPHRPASSGSAHRRSQSVSDDMPPVPALPKNIDTATPGQTSRGVQQEPQNRKVKNRAMGAPVRLASQKLASGEAPSWFGAAKLGDLGSVRRTDPAMASPPSSPLQVLAGDRTPSDGGRPGSQSSSINFSYPTRAKLGSANIVPTTDPYAATQVSAYTNQTQPLSEDHQPAQTPRVKQPSRASAGTVIAKRQSATSSPDEGLVYDPNSRRMVRRADLLAVQHTKQAVINALQQRTGSKKKKRAPQRAGSHLAAGTMGRTSRTPNDASYTSLETKVQAPSPAAHVQQQRPVETSPPPGTTLINDTGLDIEEPAVKAIMASPGTEKPRPEQQRAPHAVELPRITIPIRTTAPVALDAAPLAVRRQPSMVREESEPEDVEDNKEPQKAVSDALGAVPGRRRMQAGTIPETRLPISPEQNATVPLNSSSGDVATARVIRAPKIDTSVGGKPNHPVPEIGRAAHVSGERAHSNSPVRQAHFGPVQDNLTVRHSPPPRSISPRKSAMKHTSPAGRGSPSGDTSEASGSVNQEPPVARKKSVRVSFDDGGNGGESAANNRNESPATASPLHDNRHSWLTNLGRRQDVSSFDDDMMMKSRPVLPSFGSVRNRKPRDTSPDRAERPLVRPKGETKYTSPLLPSPPLGSSNDHVLGAVLSNEHGKSKQRAEEAQSNSGHKEPLPPVVTSVEGSGYFSDSSDTSSLRSSLRSSVFEQPETSFSTTATEPRTEMTAGSTPAPFKPQINGSAANTAREVVSSSVPEARDKSAEPPVPAISISQPTPPTAENKSLGQYFTGVPGGFPEDESDRSAASPSRPSAEGKSDAKPTEVTPETNQPIPSTVQAVPAAAAEISSDSDGDIYSDAYEDLSDIEGDGFQSLDAVVESPVQGGSHPVTQEQPPQETTRQETPVAAPTAQPETSSATFAVETQLAESPVDDWEKAKAYWRSLTAEKRAQLEREAIEEAGIEADKDEVQPEPKPKKKKTVERRNSERKALAVHMAQQMMAQQGKERPANPERSYMIKPGERWTGEDESAVPTMRRTMRDEPQQQAVVAPAEGSRLRKSMRANGSGRNSHVPGMAGDRAESKRPFSSPVTATPTRTGHQRSATQAEIASSKAASAQPPLRRRVSSGSESSFKRSRAVKGQGFGFRQSMRPASPPSTQVDTRPSKRFSLRSLSPASTASPPGAHMRTTLRDSSAGRKTPTGIRMPSFSLSYGGGKKSDSKARKDKASRLADSSDEEGGGGFSSGFRSRFEDSSDDEPPTPIPALPKSASAPQAAASSATGHHHLRKESSIASTALPEELEESEASHDANASPVVTNNNTTTLRRTRSGKGSLLPGSQTMPSTTDAAQTQTSGKTKRRNSFMSVLRHRKRDNGSTANTKIGRPEISESAARRDTRLERSVGQLERIRSVGEGEGETEEEASPRSQRLQKRGSNRGAGIALSMDTGLGKGQGQSQGPGNDNLSLTGRGNEQDEATDIFPAELRRSSTSGNLGTRTLSGGGGTGGGGFFHHLGPHRRVSSLGVGIHAHAPDHSPSVDGSVVDGSVAGASSTTRRKRFGALRRIFGIND